MPGWRTSTPCSAEDAGRDKAAIDGEQMLREEYAHVLGGRAWFDKKRTLPELIAALQAKGDKAVPAALCLSGGGIRSATFSLGVLQWLAASRQLQDFHYLSTVSGGGYIGSFLVNGLCQASQHAQDLERDKGPVHPKRLERVGRAASLRWMRRLGQSAGEERAAAVAGAARLTDGGQDPIAPLRAFSNYLSPTGGLSTDAFALVAIFLRNLLLNLLVWLPVLAAVVAAPRLYIAALTGGPSLNPPAVSAWWPIQDAWPALREWWPLGAALLAIVLGIGYIVADLPAPPSKATPPARPSTSIRAQLWNKVSALLTMRVSAALGEVVSALPPHWRRRLPSWLPRAPARTQAAPPSVPSDHFDVACFVPITGAAFVLSLLGAWTEPLHKGDWLWFCGAGAAAHLLGIGVGLVLRKLRGLGPRPASVLGFISVGLAGAVGGLLTLLVLSQLGQGAVVAQLTVMQRLLYASFAVPALTTAFWLAMAVHAGVMGRASTEEDREWWARATAAWLKFTVIWIVGFGLLVWAPMFLLEYLGGTGVAAVKFGLGGGALGIVTALFGYWSKHGDQVKHQAKGVLDATGLKLLDLMAAAVLATVLITLSLTWNAVLDRCHDWDRGQALCFEDVHAQTDVLREQALASAAAASAAASDVVRVLPPEVDPASAQTAELGTSAGAQVFAHVLLHGSGWTLTAACVVLVGLASLLALCMGANQFSLHGMYGNRLVRAYLGSGRPVRHPHWFTGFDPGDNPRMADMKAPLHTRHGPRLFPLINIALNLVKPSEKRLDWQQRKAASFFASPLHCGSAHLGFRPSAYYAGGMTLGRAMTISGAAASPNMGYHSSPLVTAVMTLFNVRLGWWSPNPEVNPAWFNEQPALGLDIMLAEAGGATGDEDDFVYLSDGGHFDNTGIYEMVRRRCQRIVLVDATCDGEFRWSDLLDVVRKIRVDFGIPIEFQGELPGKGRQPDHPRWLTGTIRYSARDPGIRDGSLIVLKPMLLPGDPPELEAYARDSAKPGTPADDPGRFPHQSTADQFFDEQQFESYRLLGWVTAKAALGDPPPGPPARKPRKAAGLARLVATAVTAQKAAPAKSGSFGELVQQMGSGVALATAITIGGTLGVAGSVALQPAEVSLSAEDRALLRQARTPGDTGRDGSAGAKGDKGDPGPQGGGVDVPALELSPEARSALDRGIDLKGAPELTRAAADLRAAARALEVALRNGVKLDAGDHQLLQQLKLVIRSTDAKAGEPQDLTTAIHNLQQTLAVLNRNETPPALKKPLEDLMRAINNVAPRQNIRGQEGGAR